MDNAWKSHVRPSLRHLLLALLLQLTLMTSQSFASFALSGKNVKNNLSSILCQ